MTIMIKDFVILFLLLGMVIMIGWVFILDHQVAQLKGGLKRLQREENDFPPRDYP